MRSSPLGALATILEVLPDDDASATLSSWLVPLLLACYLGLLLATAAVLVRGLRDTGRTGWRLFLMLLLGPIDAVLLVAFASGDSGPDNGYGPHPQPSCTKPWGNSRTGVRVPLHCFDPNGAMGCAGSVRLPGGRS